MMDLSVYREFDPDEIKGRADDARSVIFIDGKVYVDQRVCRAHPSMVRDNSKMAAHIRNKLKSEWNMNDTKSWLNLYNKYLFGRVGGIADQETGATTRFASFWGRGSDYANPAAHGPVDQIPACIQALYYKDLVDDDTIVVYGDGRVALVSDLLAGGGPTGNIDQEVIDKTELAKKMHLARGNEKKEIMKKLGVGGGGKQNDWNRQLIQNKLLAPGQSYWRMHSEGFASRLNAALNHVFPNKVW